MKIQRCAIFLSVLTPVAALMITSGCHFFSNAMTPAPRKVPAPGAMATTPHGYHVQVGVEGPPSKHTDKAEEKKGKK